MAQKAKIAVIYCRQPHLAYPSWLKLTSSYIVGPPHTFHRASMCPSYLPDSTYGHITKLTEEIVAGAKSTGAQVDVFQIPETLPAEVLAKQGAIPRPDVPVITPEKLPEYDGFIFGSPTRYGRVTSQVSAFFDRTGKLWDKGALVGKFATIHGGIEETALTTLPFFFHHGISYVPLGYTNEDLTNVSEIIGASASGAGTVAGPNGERTPTAIDLKVARHHSAHFANIVNTYVAGKHALAS